MRADRRTIHLSLIFLFALPAVCAQREGLPSIFAPRVESMAVLTSPAPSSSPISDRMREVLMQRVLTDTGAFSSLTASAPKAELPRRNEVVSTDALLMAPMIVQADRVPDLVIRRENTVQKFFRTGTFVESVGKKVTTKVWARGDSGIMLTFSW